MLSISIPVLFYFSIPIAQTNVNNILFRSISLLILTKSNNLLGTSYSNREYVSTFFSFIFEAIDVKQCAVSATANGELEYQIPFNDKGIEALYVTARLVHRAQGLKERRFHDAA